MMGQNLYGYDWTLPFVKGGAYARAISLKPRFPLPGKIILYRI